MRASRRAMLGAGLLGAAALAGRRASRSAGARDALQWRPEADSRPKASLKELAVRGGLLFGSALDVPGLDDPAYRRLFQQECGIMTTENALKFDWLRPRPEVFDFGPADRLVAFASSSGLQTRGHNLAWNDNLPKWLGSLTAAETTKIFDAHIETVVSRYAGRLHSWDVVNEPFWPQDGEPGGYRAGYWLAAMGPSYIERALRLARRFDRKARLVLNEAQCEVLRRWGQTIRPRLLALIDDLQHKGVPLDAVGLEGHLQPQWGYDDDSFLDFVRRIAERRLDVYVTELDVNDRSLADDPKARDAQVAGRYASFLTHVLKEPRVRLVETWGLADSFSWYRNLPGPPTSRRRARPLPYDSNLEKKLAWDAIAQALQSVCGSSSACGDQGERLVTN